jgi:hypothetical protein
MRSAAISRHQQSSLANSECVVIRFVTSKFRMFGHQVRHEQTPNVWSSGSSRANSECVVIRFVTSKLRMCGHQMYPSVP